MTNTCEHCGEDFEGRKDARYCRAAHRVAAARARALDVVGAPEPVEPSGDPIGLVQRVLESLTYDGRDAPEAASAPQGPAEPAAVQSPAEVATARPEPILAVPCAILVGLDLTTGLHVDLRSDKSRRSSRRWR